MPLPSATPPAPTSVPSLHRAVFAPIGDEGRAELVERRIAEAITGGLIATGERLPAETDLARSLAVAPATVREALDALRERGLIVTRRGRNGGSFVADQVDPVAFTRRRLAAMSRGALRDLATHYAALTASCARLAADRVDAEDVDSVRVRLARADLGDGTSWRHASDEALTEISALGQSVRLTREQMKLQAEFSPLLALAAHDTATRGAQQDALTGLLDALDRGNPDAAATAVNAGVEASVRRLIDLHQELSRA